MNGTALLVCDVHNDLLASVRGKGWPVVYSGLSFREDYQDVLSVAPRITKARESKVAVRGEWGAELHPDIAPRVGDIVFYKQSINPFFGTPLLEWLRRNGVGNLLIAGNATNLVVESAARYVDDAGFAVSVVENCCASPNPVWHEFAVTQILPVFGKVITSKEIK